MKQTHKLKALGDVSKVLQSARSVAAAARILGVHVATVYRWRARESEVQNVPKRWDRAKSLESIARHRGKVDPRAGLSMPRLPA